MGKLACSVSGLGVLFGLVLFAAGASAQPIPGQIIVDPDHPQHLIRQDGGPVYISGPGDPENFLFRGTRNADGTRDGDQLDLVQTLIDNGGNVIYMQAVRSHGGDGDSSHNPFIDNRASNGLSTIKLDQWEEWFTLMDDNDIVVYLYLYDDGVEIYGDADDVEPDENDFLVIITNYFKHHRNIIFSIAEEYDEVLSEARMENIAAVIKATDEHDHVISGHHADWGQAGIFQLAGMPSFDQWALYAREADDTLELHQDLVQAYFSGVDDDFGIAMVELWPDHGTGADHRHNNWACGMAAAHALATGMDIEGTPIADMQSCRIQQQFMESTDFNTMQPSDALRSDGTKWVLADAPRSYIAYAEPLDPGVDIGLRSMVAGSFDLSWLDTVSGERVEELGVAVVNGTNTFTPPVSFGNEVAVWIRPAVFDPDGDGVTEDDNCPIISNPEQEDSDDDGAGDACDDCPFDADDDIDGDMVCGDVDNCPDVANDQTDTDGDLIGDGCDVCPNDETNDAADGDGVCQDLDNCPDAENSDQDDADEDGAGDACDVCPNDATDDAADGDGVCQDVDNCPDVRNDDQADADEDGAGDACDVCIDDVENDADGDGACETDDNCPLIANDDQADLDMDGVGDLCDEDIDGDLTLNADDCAPMNPGDGAQVPPILTLVITRDDTGGAVLEWLEADSGLDHGEGGYVIVTGGILALWFEEDFRSACRLRIPPGLTYTDTRPFPARGDGWYYLMTGENDCGIGDLGSSMGPVDPRGDLVAFPPPDCP